MLRTGSLSLSRRCARAGLALSVVLVGLSVVAVPAAPATTTLTVSTTADTGAAAGACGDASITTVPSPLSLREATCLADNLGGDVTINVPSGTYDLTDGELRLGDEPGQNTSIVGAGAASTVIDAGGLSRVLELDFNLTGGVVTSISGLTLRGGNDDTFGGGAIIAGSGNSDTLDSLTISNSTITGNQTSPGVSYLPGGAVQFIGGSLSISNSTISDNSSGDSSGGGVFYQAQGVVAGESLTVTGSTFTGNSAGTGDGGAIAVDGGSAALHYNRFTGNTASSGSAVSAVVTGVDASENWWGCNAGPGATGCDMVSGGPTVSPRLVLTASANPASVTGPDATSTITATLTQDSLGAAVDPAQLGAFDGLPVSWTDPQPAGATVSAASSNLSAGSATVTYDSQAASGAGHVLATLDQGTATATLTVVAGQPPTVTLNPVDQIVAVGASVTFSAAVSGVPTPTVQWQRSTDGGVSFTNIAGATSTSYSFTAAAGDDGNQYRAVFSNAAGTATTTAATLSVGSAPAFTSADHTSFLVGQAGSFTITTTGQPTAALSETGSLPPGMSFTDNGNGTVTLSGTPTAGTTGSYPLTLTAANSAGSTQQAFTLTVQPPNSSPVITSADQATFSKGVAGSFAVTTTGFPTPAITKTGTLPAGVTFTDNHNGTATIAGTATVTGTFAITITANNGVPPNATQAFTLTVTAPPAITSANTVTFTSNVAGSFTVTTTGFPTAAITETGALPAGVSFTDNGNGTATIAGTPTLTSSANFALTIKASNGFSPDASQAFTLKVTAVGTVESITSSTPANFGAYQGIGSWFNMKLSGGTYSNLSQYSSAYPAQWQEPGGYPHVRDYLMHPQTSAAAVRKWVAQQAGNVTITGTIGKLDSRSSGVIATISKNTTVLWSATVPPATYVTPTGVSGIHVEPGDALYFTLGVNGSMNYDETYWYPTVTETTALTLQAASYDGMSGVTTSATTDTGGGSQVNSFDTGDYLLYRNVYLSGGYKTLQARIADVVTGGKFEVRLDSLTGPVVSTFTVASTDSWNTWETQTWPFSTTATGVHDLYIRGVVGSGIADIHWVRLAGTNSRGATEPFTTYEAEQGLLGGGAALNVNTTVQQQAASGRSYVHLAGTGQSVQWGGVRDANRLILRYSIPQGTSGTLGLYINGVKRTDLALNSTYNYDTQPNNTLVRSFDDQDFAVEINAGDTVMLQKDSASTLAWYGIDLIDLETAIAPLTMPTGYVSVKDYNAQGDGVTDDTTAIQNAVNAAASSGKSVWFPPGTYNQSNRITVPSNVNVKGAGVWWSHLHNTVSNTNWGGAIGFRLNNNTTVSDLRITGVDTQRNGITSIVILTTAGTGQNNVLTNLWVQHTVLFEGWTDWAGSTIQNCRVYDLYGGGIHWRDGSNTNNLAANNYFRGIGEDAISQANFTNSTTHPHDNTAQFNTIIASYAGRGMADIGGNTLTYRDNIIDSTYLAGMMVATESESPYVAYPINGLKFQRNTINLASHTGMNHGGLHFWLGTNPMSNVHIDLNTITNGFTNGIRIETSSYGDSADTLFDFNTAQNNAQANYVNYNSLVKPILTQNIGF